MRSIQWMSLDVISSKESKMRLRRADETRQFITDFRSDMDGAHEAFFGNGKKTFSKKTKI